MSIVVLGIEVPAPYAHREHAVTQDAQVPVLPATDGEVSRVYDVPIDE